MACTTVAARPQRPLRMWLTVLSLAVCVAAVGACTANPARPAGTATIIEVIDGDTVVVGLSGRDETVRLLGIDTPETKHPTTPPECFGAEASARTAALLAPGTEVRLERDVEARDMFGRLLAYVHTTAEGTFVNLALVREGAADVLIISPNQAYATDLRAAAAEAREAGRGLWGACGGPDTPAGVSQPVPSVR